MGQSHESFILQPTGVAIDVRSGKQLLWKFYKQLKLEKLLKTGKIIEKKKKPRMG